jgi:PPOX class probable F420-dependent enzyme
MDKLTQLLADSEYVLLTTFRRNGAPVATPVWLVGDGGSLAVWTAQNSGKVKRIRRDAAVELAPCDLRGTPFGRLVPARAHVLDEAETQRVEQLVARKYGLRGRAYLAVSHRRRGHEGSIALSITLS